MRPIYPVFDVVFTVCGSVTGVLQQRREEVQMQVRPKYDLQVHNIEAGSSAIMPAIIPDPYLMHRYALRLDSIHLHLRRDSR